MSKYVKKAAFLSKKKCTKKTQMQKKTYWVYIIYIQPRENAYPDYVSGGAFLLSKKLAMDLAMVKEKVSILPIGIHVL